MREHPRSIGGGEEGIINLAMCSSTSLYSSFPYSQVDADALYAMQLQAEWNRGGGSDDADTDVELAQLIQIEEQEQASGMREPLKKRRAPERSHAPTPHRREPLVEKTCPVCIESIASGSGGRLRTLSCCHTFHTKCINHWLKINRTCPVCRTEVGQK
jgi:hypothetical protein